jgi:hypothetical protein
MLLDVPLRSCNGPAGCGDEHSWLRQFRRPCPGGHRANRDQQCAPLKAGDRARPGALARWTRVRALGRALCAYLTVHLEPRFQTMAVKGAPRGAHVCWRVCAHDHSAATGTMWAPGASLPALICHSKGSKSESAAFQPFRWKAKMMNGMAISMAVLASNRPT